MSAVNKGPEDHLKHFVAFFCQQTWVVGEQNSKVSCCPLAVIGAFSNYSKTNSVWYFRMKWKKTAKPY